MEIEEKENSQLLNQSSEKPKEPWRNLIAFFLIGLINNYSYVVMLSAAKDILHNSDKNLPTGTILLADTLPNLFIKLIAPFFMERIPYAVRVITIFFSASASFQLVAWPASIYLKIFGVCLASFGTGLGFFFVFFFFLFFFVFFLFFFIIFFVFFYFIITTKR